MNIKVNETNNKIAGCVYSSKEENILIFTCKINGLNQKISDKILISENTEGNTLIFNSESNQDKNIIIYKYISFIEAKKLIYNDNKWKFLIIVPYQTIPIGTKSIVDILYNGALSSATCFSDDNSMLNCQVDKEEQEESDLVKIHYIKSERSTIKWSDLTKIYEIPIEKELTYINSYNLVYTSTKLWSFKIKYLEQIIPENALITIDMKINDESSLAKCYHQNDYELNCKTQIVEEETLSLKISYEKKDGSISWENIKTKNIPITISSRITYIDSYDLHFTDNSWSFSLKANIIKDEINYKFPFSIKIEYGIEKNIGVAYCYPVENNEELFNCEVYYEEQSQNDLILISGSQEDVSVIWNTAFEEEKNIILLASLNYVKAYELMFLEEEWIFKIKVENNLPNGSKLKVDILFNDTQKDTATCFYNDKILSCTRDSEIQSPSESLKLLIVKESGSVSWEGIEDLEVKMPLTIKKNLVNAYGLYFDDKWNFYLDIENIGIIPDDSYFELDILKDEEETIAICELSNRTQSTTISILFCHLEDEEQSRTNEIKINTEKKEGSINLQNSITELNNTISETNSEPTPFYLLDAFDMEFVDNVWIFTIIGKADRDLYKGEVFKIDIKYILLEGEFDTKAKCWTNGGAKNKNISLDCYAEKEGQTEKGLIQIKYFQSSVSTLIWNGGIDDNYQITLKGMSLILVKAYGLTLDKTWKFKINIEGKQLPPGVQIVIDVKIGINLKSLICTSLNSASIICDTGTSIQNELITISENSLLDSSVKWIEKRQPDYKIYLNFKFEYVSVYNLYFDMTVNIWIFVLKKQGIIPLGSKLSVDILYNDIASIATCFYNDDNDELKCSVERENQNKMDLVQLNHIKTSESSITLLNLFNDEKISLICDLTLVSAENLRIGEDGFWIFEIDISDETIPNYSKFVIDIYYKINLVESFSSAVCYLDNKKLSCKTEFNSLELITIKLTKTENSLSTVTWKNKEEFENDKIPMVITTSLNHVNFTKIIYIENRYYFYINLANKIPQEGEVIIDIDIDGVIKTCICQAEANNKLKCEIKGDDYQQNAHISVIPKNTDHSTVSWVNLETPEEVNVFYLVCMGAYNKKSLNQTHFGFNVLTSGAILRNGYKIYVRINYIDSNGNVISSTIAPCTANGDFLICEALKNNYASDFKLYLASPSTSSSSSEYYYDGIIWSNGNNENTPVYSSLNLNLEVNSFDYNSESNCYEFTFQDTNYNSGSTFFVTDITIGGKTTYAYCNYVIDHFKCKTSKINYNENDEILISKTKTYGSVDWTNLSGNKKISNLYFVEISQIFDLNFVEGKWTFKIKSNGSSSSEKIFKLDILISGTRGFANCTINEGMLECTVDSDTQNSESLISLYSNVEGDIKFSNLKETFIPLNLNLLFNKLYDLSYSSFNGKWSFEIQAELNEEKIIPDNSKFTIDIKCDDVDDIAICSKKSLQDNIITLICQTKNQASQNSLISLKNEKSTYSSITWAENIPENLEIFIDAEINVKTVENLVFNISEEKWSFEMNLNSNYNYPSNSKFKIDLIYNNQETTAT